MEKQESIGNYKKWKAMILQENGKLAAIIENYKNGKLIHNNGKRELS